MFELTESEQGENDNISYVVINWTMGSACRIDNGRAKRNICQLTHKHVTILDWHRLFVIRPPICYKPSPLFWYFIYLHLSRKLQPTQAGVGDSGVCVIFYLFTSQIR